MSPAASQDSANGSESLILVFGDDDFEVRARCAAVLGRWRNELPEVDPEYVDGNASTIAEMQRCFGAVTLALESLSLFGSGKLVWFRNCNFVGNEGRLASSSQTTDALGRLMKSLDQCDWASTRFLMSCTGIDKRKRFYKWFERTGQVISCESLAAQGDRGESIAIGLIQDHVSNANKTIQFQVAEQLVRYVGLDRRVLVSECEKAILHSGHSTEVTEADVEAVVSQSKQAKAFAFADAVADRKLNQALVRLDEELWAMRTDREKSEMGLLYGLISKFRNMLMVKGLVAQGRLRVERNFPRFRSQLSSLDSGMFPEDRRFNPLSQNPYVIFRALSQVGNYSQSELVGALSSLMTCNTRMISVGDEPASVLRECVIEIVLGRQR